MTKNKHISFRCTEDDWSWIIQIAESDDRTPSYILNKMIKVFRNRGVFNIDQIN